MIRALDGQNPACRQAERAFLAAAEAQPLPGAELASAWYAFGKGQARGAGGWHFFAAGPDEKPFALALRGGAAWACGVHDPEEWGAFLRYANVRRLTLRAGGPPPQGFAPTGQMRGFCLPVRPHTPAPPPLPAGLETAGPLADFLLREGTFSEDAPAAQNSPDSAPNAGRQAAALFARELDARAAVGLGHAALLISPAGQPAAGLAALTGVHGRAVSLAAVQVRSGLRGRGLGGWLVQTAAAIAHHGGSALWLLCIPQRAGFYARLGFLPQGDWFCLAPGP